MKQVSNMSELFERLNDLKLVFRYGQKLIPVIQSIIDFMKETVPLLENINQSIADSTSKIPKATDQITNVTSATELATTEILDIVDAISNDASGIENNCKNLLTKEQKRKELMSELKKVIAGNNEAVLLLQKYEINNHVEQILSQIVTSMDKMKNDAYNITLSLQVQDITSQQLAAVNHLIESVQEKLASLIVDLKESDIKEFTAEEHAFPETSSFDPNARYNKSAQRQEVVDSIINEEKGKTSQDEIDKLFS